MFKDLKKAEILAKLDHYMRAPGVSEWTKQQIWTAAKVSVALKAKQELKVAVAGGLRRDNRLWE